MPLNRTVAALSLLAAAIWAPVIVWVLDSAADIAGLD